MIIKKLTIQNFGVFSGQQEFDLRPGKVRNIILIGGMNGAGKTTLFTSIRICLYGILAFGIRMKTADYKNFIRERMDRKDNSLLSYIELTFEYVQSGEKNDYRIRRTWKKKNDDIEELFELWKEDQLVTDLDPEQWGDFIQELIPLGIADLFFFDGEKIQSLAEDGNQNLSDAVKSLLNLEIIERLSADLSIYIRKQSKQNKNTEEYDKITKRIEDLREKLEKEIATKCGKLSQNIARCNSKIEKQEQKISQEGGHFSDQRDKLKIQRAKNDTLIKQVENEIRNLCSGLFPFSLVPNLCESVRDQIGKEQEYQSWESNRRYWKKKQNEIKDGLDSNNFWEGLDFSSDQKTSIKDKFLSLMSNATDPNTCEDVSSIHDLSEKDQQVLLADIEICLKQVPKNMADLCSKLEKLNKKRLSIEKKFNKAPADDVIKPLIENLKSLGKELHELQTQEKIQEEEKRKTEFELQDLIRQRDKLDKKFTELSKNQQAVESAGAVKSVLLRYITRLTALKIEDLCKKTTWCFQELCRKKNWVEHMAVNQSNFGVTLYDKDNKGIPKESLSAGEKQIYAIALLWGLALTSQRPLPIIIDTPLGRLDSQHRKQLIDNYFPNASHQTIILSTDTEVDQQFFKDLQPKVFQAYYLKHDMEKSATTVQEGYFWE